MSIAASLALYANHQPVAPPVSAYPAAGPLQFALDTVYRAAGEVPAGPAPPEVRAGERLTLTGWVVAAAPGSPAVGIEERRDTGRFTAGTYGTDRDDVARYYRRRDAERSGFMVTFGAGAPGTHRLALRLVLADGRRLPLSPLVFRTVP